MYKTSDKINNITYILLTVANLPPDVADENLPDVLLRVAAGAAGRQPALDVVLPHVGEGVHEAPLGRRRHVELAHLGAELVVERLAQAVAGFGDQLGAEVGAGAAALRRGE